MTDLEPTLADARGTALQSSAESAASIASTRRTGRFVRYLAGRGLAHLTLLTFTGIFLFPFVYMVGTSLKTEEELVGTGWFPAIPKFQPDSPRIRATPSIARPLEAPADKWNAAIPLLNNLTRAAVDKSPLPAGTEAVDAESLRSAAADALLSRIVPRLNLDLWDGPTEALVASVGNALNADTVAEAINDRLARLEIRGLQARTLDSHLYSITGGDSVANTWKIESGDASFLPAKDAAILRYQFKSPSALPVILRCDFNYPADPAKLHKLIFSIKPDDSWHQVDATLELGGVRWVSQKTKYLGTNRRQSLLFQPPSFDDTTDRARIWVPLKASGALAAGVDPRHGVLRITIAPSSTLDAIWGKVRRNYERAFNRVPFWRYVGNSLLLVMLTTLGTLFSSAFVAYAFARLNWPGRAVAFGILLSTMMLPAQVTMIPSFMIWRAAGLYNTLCPLWIPAWFGSAFFIFLMVQHMRTIPRELEEAARIDGCSALRTWAQIILPQTKPALAAIAIMTSMGAWNEFMGPLIYLRDQSIFPLSLGLYGLRLDAPEGGTDWTMIMAGNVLMTLPVLIIFFLFQRYFIQGMTMSGMK